jgi:similar to spore coat protein
MFQQNLALHETMEIHELLNLKTICMTKSKMIQGIVFDQELKALLEKDVQQSITQAKVLQDLLAKTQQTTTNGGASNGIK